MKSKIKDVNLNISGIETKVVKLYDEMINEKRIKFQESGIKDKLIDYVFGKTEENPFESITETYYKNLKALEEQLDRIAGIEKQNYLGKSKKSVNFVKSLKIEPNNM